MTQAPAWVDHLTTLPGPRRHVGRIKSVLEQGLSCTWVLPRRLIDVGVPGILTPLLTSSMTVVSVHPPGPREQPAQQHSPPPPSQEVKRSGAAPTAVDELLDSLLAARRSVLTTSAPPAVVAPSEEVPSASLDERVFAALDDQTGSSPQPSRDPWDALARWQPPCPVVLLVDASREVAPEALESLVRRYPTTARNHGAIGSSPRLLVITPPDGVSPHLLEVGDDLGRTVVWWWDVLQRLDLLVLDSVTPGPTLAEGCARSHMDRLTPDLLPETVAELAAWDLDLAVVLLNGWNGSRDHLEDLLDQHAAPLDSDPTLVHGHAAGTARPAQRLLPLFSRGAIFAWDGWPRTSLLSQRPRLREKNVSAALHRAQQRSLTVAVEQRRATYEEQLRMLVRRTSPQSQAERLRDPSPMELTEILAACRTVGSAPRSLMDGVVATRTARNALAHLGVADERCLQELVRHP